MNKAANDYGEVDNQDEYPVLRFERQFRHPPATVWAALVEPGELAGWFPCRIEGERKLDATLHFVFEGDDSPPAEGKIVGFEPPHHLAYLWDVELLRWELHPNEQGCSLIFTNVLVDTRYSTLNSAVGWHVCFDILQAQLDGDPVTWDAEERMEVLRAEYGERLAG